MTSLIMVNAAGEFSPPMIIFKAKRLPPIGDLIVYDDNGDRILYTVGKSDSGWINFPTLYEYLCNTFHNWLTAKKIDRPVIVYCDWHETRSNHFLAQRCTQLGIILVILVPNTTHFF